MSQQYPFGSPNDKYKRKLFVDVGMEYMEVKARIIEPYSSPSPQPQAKEIKIINAPSHFHQTGISSYKLTLNLLFNSKEDYHDYLTFIGWTHKYYDEKGNIYEGIVDAPPKAEPYEGMKRYKVEISLTLIKKDSYDKQNLFQYIDLETADGSPHWAKKDIEEMANLGLVVVSDLEGNPVLYFRPNDFITRAEFVTFLMRTKRLLERIIRE